MHARVDKLGKDIERLASASAEDWWDLSKARVNDYIDRVEKSVARLDDTKKCVPAFPHRRQSRQSTRVHSASGGTSWCPKARSTPLYRPSTGLAER